MVLIKSKPEFMLTDRMFPKAFNALLDNFFEDRKSVSGQYSFMPAADLIEHDSSYEIRMALPGIKKEDIKVSLDGDHLTVEGERKILHTDEKSSFLKREMVYGKFNRSFTIGKADGNGIEAKFADGILSISVPKFAEEKSSVIEVK